jgi:hypothetical protein
MIRIKGCYRNQRVELEHPLNLAEGTEIEIDVHTADEIRTVEDEGWRELGMSRLESEWENPKDAIYDDWRKLYGV